MRTTLSGLALGLLVVGVVLVGANAFVLSPIMGDVARELGTDPIRIARSISAFGATTAFSAFLLSGLVDRYGPRITLAGCAALVGIAQVVAGLSASWQMLAASQALAGLAVGVMLPAIYATATSTAPEGRETGRLGTVLTGWAVSLVAAVPLSAFMTSHFGWRSIYLTLAVASFAVAAGYALRMPRALGGKRSASRPMQAFMLPGVLPVLLICLVFMTGFYGTFSYFGEGVRAASGQGAGRAGLYVMAYGLGFGLSGALVGRFGAIRSQRGLVVLLFAISFAYFAMSVTLAHPVLAMLNAAAWGFLNQYGVNGIIVLLNRAAPHAGGAAMGLHSTVTYLAVFLGPWLMSLVYLRGGFPAVTTGAGILLLATAVGLVLFGGRDGGTRL